MRRTLKPFVTEYKSANRKTKDLFDAAPATAFVEPAAPIAPEGMRFSAPSTDSYEEALRAADALFGTPALKHETPAVAPKLAEHHQGGRILQAIEDDVPDPFAQLEAERGPKRRGRKPGSKNRPKLPVAAQKVALVATPPAAPIEVRRQVVAAPSREATPPRERFAWVRTTLRPGEKWKRRLPKVAW